MIEYDDVKAQLTDLIAISDMALIDWNPNNIYATLNVTKRAIQQLVDKLEEREKHDRRTQPTD